MRSCRVRWKCHCHLIHCRCKILVIAALMHKYNTGIIQPSRAQCGSTADSVSCSSVQSSPACTGRMHRRLSHVWRSAGSDALKRGIKTKNGGMKEGRTLERHGEAETHHTCRHASTHAFLLNEGQAGVFVSHRESCQSVLWQQLEEAWVDGSAFTKIKNI